MEEHFAIYSLDEVELSLKEGQEEIELPLNMQKARQVVFNGYDEPHPEEEYDEQDVELESESRVVYPSDVRNGIDEIFNKGVEPPISAQSHEEIDYTLRTLKNRVTSLEIQNKQLSQQAQNLELELNETEDKYENRITELQGKMDNERFKHKAELTELTKKHQEDLVSKQTMNGKLENVDKLRRENDDLVMENQKLETKLEKLASEQGTAKTDLSLARIELTKLKAEMAKMKAEFEANKSELGERNSEIIRLKRDGDSGKGNLDQQFKQLNIDKKYLEDQVSSLKQEVTGQTTSSHRLTSDLKVAERNISVLSAEKSALQLQANRVDGLERELHQAKWQVGNLEQQLRDSTADASFRIAQAQQQAQQAQQQAQQIQQQAQQQVQQAQAQAHSRAMSLPLPMPMSMPLAQPMPTYSPAYVPPPPATRHNPNPAQYNAYQPPPSNYSNNTPSLAALAAGTGFGAAAAYNPQSYSGYPSSSSGAPTANSHHKRSASAVNPIVDSTASAPFGTVSKSPFANEVTSAQINHVFDDLDRKLTTLMTEKTNLNEESERLHGRGLKTLKDRTRLQNVEHRLGELSKDISHIRKELSFKPG